VYNKEIPMMQPRQWEANKANAQLSTGPTSDAGKQIVSQNALRHGLSGRVHAALAGEQEPFALHCRAWRDAMLPVGTVEETLTKDIAADHWRLNRARTMENALFTQIEMAEDADPNPATADAQAWVDPSKGLQRIALYAARIQRAIEKNTNALQALQLERKAAYAEAQAQAIALIQLAEAKGQIYDPAPDFQTADSHGGFVYSAAEVARIRSRARRLEEARSRFAQAA
jgi:hypothetical protein